MKLSVIGTGYVGLVTGTCFADIGFNVCCVDISPEKVDSLKNGVITFYEPGLENLVKRNIETKNLFFTSDSSLANNFAEIIFVCVGTPQDSSGKPDLSYLLEYFSELLDQLRSNRDFLKNPDLKKHVFIKSTIPPGTINHINSIISENGLDNKVLVSSNPEFLKEGSAIQDFMKPDRVVVGSSHPESITIAKELYRTIMWKSDRMLITSPESAEIIKYSANAFLAMKISFINQISRLSDAIGGDIHDIRKGIGMDERINPHFLYAGLGYGGSCFPKDVSGLEFVLESNNLTSELITATRNVNNSQLEYFYKKIVSFYDLDELKGKDVAFWGLSFKPNTDDIRESIGIKLIRLIAPLVNHIYAYEPVALKNAMVELEDIKNISFVSSSIEALQKSHFLILATEYTQFWNTSPDYFLHLKDRCIFDGRNILDKKLMLQHNITYFGIGR